MVNATGEAVIWHSSTLVQARWKEDIVRSDIYQGVLMLIRASAANLVNWHLRIPRLTGTIDYRRTCEGCAFGCCYCSPLPWVLLGISFLYVPENFMVRRETLGYEDSSRGMTIVIRLKSATPETWIVERAARTGQRDKRIQHLFPSWRVLAA